MGDGEIRATGGAGALRAGPREAVHRESEAEDREAATELRRRGTGWQSIGAFFGIPHETVRRFAVREPGATAFVPVVVRGVDQRWAVAGHARTATASRGSTLVDVAEISGGCDDHAAAHDPGVGVRAADGSAQGLQRAGRHGEERAARTIRWAAICFSS